MRLTIIAANALNHAPSIDNIRKRKIATRFRLVFCEFSHAWHPEEDCVTLEDGTWCHHSQAVEYGGEYYAYSNTENCPCCDERFPADDGHGVRYNGRNRLWCSPCWEDESFCCDNCNITYSNAERSDCEDSALCLECGESNATESIPSWHQATRPRMPRDKEDFPFWSLELELELGSSEDRADFLNEVKSLNISNLIWEKDGSLCSERGIEMIFCYYETKELLLHDLSKVCSIARKHRGCSWYLHKRAGRWAGCHINRNKAVWKHRELMRLVYLIERNKNLLIKLAGRECESYAPYSNAVLYGARRRLHAIAGGHQGKYAALNLSSFGRIEWRLFSGSLNIRRLGAYLNAVEGLENLAKGRALHYLAKAGADVIQRQIELIEAK